MATEMSLEPELSWEPPKPAFETTDFIDTKGMSYDVTADGQRILVVKRTRKAELGKLHIVLNWDGELQGAGKDTN